MVASQFSGLQERMVLDWNNRPVGRVMGIEEDPRTHDLATLRISLEPGLAGDDGKLLEVPMEKVFGIRREAVQLNESVVSLIPQLPAMPESTIKATLPDL